MLYLAITSIYHATKCTEKNKNGLNRTVIFLRTTCKIGGIRPSKLETFRRNESKPPSHFVPCEGSIGFNLAGAGNMACLSHVTYG